MIFVESNAGMKELNQYFPGYNHKIRVVNIFPSNLINFNVNELKQKKFLQQLEVETNKFFFYPAQFWAHKNHYNLIRAFDIFLKETNSNFNLVLTGSDKGNLANIENLISDLNLNKFIKLAGFVTDEHIYILYKNAFSLVMPTHLGPTNMPVLEALALGCPIICSDFEGHREQASDCALYVDPSSYNEIKEAMILLYKDPSLRDELLLKSRIHIGKSQFNVASAVEKINLNIENLGAMN